MKTNVWAWTLLCLISFGAGCMHTVTGSGKVLSPDGTLAVWVRKHGASGKAFSDMTLKRVFIVIGPVESKVQEKDFVKELKFTAADLEQNTVWKSTNEVQITFYDFGDGISSYDRRGAPSNYVGTVWLRRGVEKGWSFESDLNRKK
jgi:hypothetical protein